MGHTRDLALDFCPFASVKKKITSLPLEGAQEAAASEQIHPESTSIRTSFSNPE